MSWVIHSYQNDFVPDPLLDYGDIVTPETETVLLALVTALLAAATNIVLARALANMGSMALAQTTNLGNALLLGVYGFWVTDFSIWRWEGFAWFAVLGVFNFSLNRWMFLNGMRAMGPSRHITITSLSPLPTLLIAVLALGERPGMLVLTGTVLVVVGVSTVCYSPAKGRWLQAGIGWSVACTLVFVAGSYMRNRGMNVMPAAALLTAWAAFIALPAGMMMTPYLPKKHTSFGNAGMAVVPAVVAGIIFSSVHQVFINTTLMGQLSLAVPILSAAPVFVMLLSVIFLRDLERLNLRVVLGILITVFGMAAIGVGRHG